MRKAMPFLLIGLCVVIAVGWYFTWFSPAGDEVSDTNRQAEVLDAQSQELEAKVAALRAVADQAPALTARAAELGARVPTETSLDGFIIEANAIAQRHGIEWVSVTPSPLQGGGPAGVGVIGFTAEVRGSYDQVRSYLEDLMEGERLVVVDSVSISPGSSSAGGGEAASDELQATFDGRMFTSAVPEGYVDPRQSNTATTGASTAGSGRGSGTGVS